MTNVSLGQQVRQLQKLVGRKDVRPKDEEFIKDMLAATNHGKKTSHLTGPQVNYIESLWRQHYG